MDRGYGDVQGVFGRFARDGAARDDGRSDLGRSVCDCQPRHRLQEGRPLLCRLVVTRRGFVGNKL